MEDPSGFYFDQQKSEFYIIVHIDFLEYIFETCSVKVFLLRHG